VRAFTAGLAGASHYNRNHRDESVEIFAKWVANTDVAVGKKAIRHISYDPRLSPAVMRAFEAAEDEVLINTLKGRRALTCRISSGPLSWPRSRRPIRSISPTCRR
jgi:hypothetical protein